MRLSARTFAAMLIGLALAAAQPDANSQSRGNSRSSSVSRSTRPSGNSGSSSTKPTVGNANKPGSNKPDNSVNKPAPKKPATNKTKPSDKSTVSRPPANKPAPDKPVVNKPAPNKPEVNKPAANKPAPNKPSVNKPAPQKPAANKSTTARPKPGQKPGYKPGNAARPVGVTPPVRHPKQPRVHPRDRDFMDYNRVTIHWKNDPHYYGYRIHTLPPKAIIRTVRGVKYYVYDDVWYRPYNGYYIVSRPPFGISLAASIVSNIAWTAVQLSYYNTVANTYNTINENNEYIAQQNAVIAQNNAIIAAQNQEIALSQSKAQAAYGLANELGLVQSYGSASASYFYQDGVFYSQGPDGEYYVIVPPAGAKVDRLPEDFDVVVLNGNKYYKVDETVYQMVVEDGVPYFEVLGQMN